jgi:hypothetical protein
MTPAGLMWAVILTNPGQYAIKWAVAKRESNWQDIRLENFGMWFVSPSQALRRGDRC